MKTSKMYVEKAEPIDHKSGNGNMAKSVLAGAVGGLAASWVMTQFQSLLTALADKQKSQATGEGATVKTAEAISTQVLDHELDSKEKKWAGPAVHYAFGTIVGALYGALAERMPAARACRGTAYATAVWIAGDEIGVPGFGLAPPPTETPASTHVKALASHLVYGFTTDLARRAILRGSA
jgi:putative membrane protein